MGFQGWLGKTVVDSNLLPYKITIHMIMALLIVLLLIILLAREKEPVKIYKYNALFNKLLIISIIFSLIQIAMGTQVRQFIDEQVKLYGFENKNHSLMNPSFKFYFHRSFSILVFATHLFLWLEFKKNTFIPFSLKIIISVIGLEIFTGVLMYYLDFPITTQQIIYFSVIKSSILSCS